MNGKLSKIIGSKAQIELICDQHSLTEVNNNNEKHCGACYLFRKNSYFNKNKKELVLVKNPAGAKLNDYVEFELEENAQIKSSLILFLLPLMVFLICASIVSTLAMETWLIILISFMSLAIIYLLLKIILKNKTFYYITKIKGNFSDVNNHSGN